jgi:hypothetical protein
MVYAMSVNLLMLGVCGTLLMTLSGCCCAMSDLEGDGYGAGYGDGGDAFSDLFASEAGQYEGSEGVGSTSYVGTEDGTYVYEDYDPSTDSYDYTYQ